MTHYVGELNNVIFQCSNFRKRELVGYGTWVYLFNLNGDEYFMLTPEIDVFVEASTNISVHNNVFDFLRDAKEDGLIMVDDIKSSFSPDSTAIATFGLMSPDIGFVYYHRYRYVVDVSASVVGMLWPIYYVSLEAAQCVDQCLNLRTVVNVCGKFQFIVGNTMGYSPQNEFLKSDCDIVESERRIADPTYVEPGWNEFIDDLRKRGVQNVEVFKPKVQHIRNYRIQVGSRVVVNAIREYHICSDGIFFQTLNKEWKYFSYLNHVVSEVDTSSILQNLGGIYYLCHSNFMLRFTIRDIHVVGSIDNICASLVKFLHFNIVALNQGSKIVFTRNKDDIADVQHGKFLDVFTRLNRNSIDESQTESVKSSAVQVNRIQFFEDTRAQKRSSLEYKISGLDSDTEHQEEYGNYRLLEQYDKETVVLRELINNLPENLEAITAF